MTNSAKPLLKALYNIFREESVQFPDKPRAMKNVTIILTGNTTEEIYDEIPKNLAPEMREIAMHEIYKTFLKNNDLQQRLLQKDFPDALLARIDRNIYYFGPLEHKPKRQLTFLKLRQTVDKLKPNKSKRGWNIIFESVEDLTKIVEMIEQEGFTNKYQGASLDKYIREAVYDKINTHLLTNKIPSGETLLLKLSDQISEGEFKGTIQRKRILELTPVGSKNIMKVEIDAKDKHEKALKRSTDLVMTAYHEAGHELVNRVYFSDVQTSTYLSIRPGVAFSANHFIHYAGVKQSQVGTEITHTKEALLRQIAVLSAGYVGQELVSLGGKTDAGKSDDMQKATSIAQNAILRFGLSSEWKTQSIPANMSIADYMSNVLSENERAQVNQITKKWLQKGEKMARQALLMNYKSIFIPLAKKLSKNAELNKAEISAFYKRKKVITEQDLDFYDHLDSFKKFRKRLNKAVSNNKKLFKRLTKVQKLTDTTLKTAYETIVGDSSINESKLKSWGKLSLAEQAIAQSILSSLVKDPRRDAHLFNKRLLNPTAIADLNTINYEEKHKIQSTVKPPKGFTYSSKQCSPLFM